MFWDYFKKTLRLPFIQKAGGPLAMLAEGGADAMDAAHGVIITLRDQFLAERCEDAFLANFARSRGIVRAPLEPEANWKGRVKLAYIWWSRGGRAGLLAQVLVDYFGFESIEVANLRAEDTARWAEFRVACYMAAAMPAFTQPQVEWAINEIKPARSKLAEVMFIASATGEVPAWSFACYSAGVTIVYPEPE